MRRAGILAPVFSLPGKYGIGDFGRCAYDFIDILVRAGMKIWQVLPLGPVGYGSSPYQSYSSMAGDTNYIDLDRLYDMGLLDEKPALFRIDQMTIDYESVRIYKLGCLRQAFSHFEETDDYREFISQEWVYLYGVFRSFAAANNDRTWNEWPGWQKNWIRTREGDLSPFMDHIRFEMFCQYLFYTQWTQIKQYANEKGILIMGDIPFYVGINSLDVWMNQDEFLLTREGYPVVVAGVPPDYFSADGQRWGNPIYNWKHMQENNFTFWKNRVTYTAKMFDLIRIDHFRAFDTYWAIPASCETAKEGKWEEAPGYEFFDELLPLLKDTEIVAEDLGMMRPEVYELRDHYAFAGMKVLQFTFFDPGFKTRKKMIAYTGTHDNDTVAGWWKSLSDRQKICLVPVLNGEKKTVFDGLKKKYITEKVTVTDPHTHSMREAEKKVAVPGDPLDGIPENAVFDPALLKRPVNEYFVEYCMKEETETAIIALQDVLGLGSSARINVPGTVGSPDWEWKLITLADFRNKAGWLHALAEKTDRL